MIVYAAPRDMAEVKRLVESLDTAGSEAVTKAKVITIRNALAAEIAQTLQQAITADATTGAPSAILELMTIDERGQEIVRSGMLNNVRRSGLSSPCILRLMVAVARERRARMADPQTTDLYVCSRSRATGAAVPCCLPVHVPRSPCPAPA